MIWPLGKVNAGIGEGCEQNSLGSTEADNKFEAEEFEKGSITMVVKMIVHASFESDDCDDRDTRRERRDSLDCSGGIGFVLR